MNKHPQYFVMEVSVFDLNIRTCEMHTCGEPLRIIEQGFPKVSGQTILNKIAHIRENYDYIRKFLISEPRGHYDMFGTLQVEPDHPEADAAFIFMDNKGYNTMCGHAVIALGRYCVDKGFVKGKEPETQVNIQCPCGLVPAYVSYEEGVSGRVRFHSVPAFVFARGIGVKVPDIGELTVDIAYGGGFYAFVSSQSLGLELKKGTMSHTVTLGQKITDALKKVMTLHHPDNMDLAFLYGTIITDISALESTGTVRQVTIFADAELDRSPCGSGTTAHVALMHAKGQIGVGIEKTFESGVINTRFSAKVVRKTECGKFDAVIVEVSGNGYYTGRNQFTAEKGDPLGAGFLVK